jgi:antirestriction protein ArdC
MQITELYERVTNTIIAELETGTAPWVRPWKGSAGGFLPQNFATGRHYNGINICILWHEAEQKGYGVPQWMTFQQAIQKGACVRKGEKGTTVVFVKKLRVGEDENQRTVGMLKTFTVFNVAQIDGLPEPEATPDRPEPERDAAADAFIEATQADIRRGGDMAAFIPSKDYITIPFEKDFRGMEHFYATALHELSHWTGAKHRLNRDLTGRFKTASYAAEELVAELSAAFLCAHLGIQGELRHAAYIESWLTLLREDSKAIFTAASKASQAADYLRAFSEKEVECEAA